MFDSFKDLVRGVLSKVFGRTTIENATGEEIAISDEMSRAIDLWCSIYENKSPWISDTVTSMNLGATISQEMARLVTLEFKSEINNEFLNEEYQVLINNIKPYVEYACAKGGIVFKPYLSADQKHIEIDIVQAENFYPTSFNSRGEVTAAIFVEVLQKGKDRYYRLEYHSLLEKGYYISNKAYVKKNAVSQQDNNNLGTQIKLTDIEEWADLQEEVLIKYVDKPLFSYFRIPIGNNIDPTSPIGSSIFNKAINDIMECDKQFSRILWEFEGSELAVHASVDCFRPDPANDPNSLYNQSLYNNMQGIKKPQLQLPKGKERLYRTLDIGVGEGGNPIDIFSPTIRDSSLFNGLNNFLMQVEFKCGLAYGTISLVTYTDKTAEEIKSSKQRSYSTVKTIQDSLRTSLQGLVYAMSIWARMAGLINKSIDVKKDISYDFDDSLVKDKDKEYESMRQDVAAGILKPIYYVMERYSKTEKEAREMIPDEEEEGEEIDDQE